ncbi:MAG TPA: hypothetical protein VEG60_29375 [Candidatus Binatia bacterium]|nr:hypothetical protein [Candidatus Binatia bacterium]
MLGKVFFWLFATALLATVSSAEAQQPKKIPRIGFLFPGFSPLQSAATTDKRKQSFYEALQEQGFTAGKDVIIDYRYSKGNPRAFPRLAAQLVASKIVGRCLALRLTAISADMGKLRSETSCRPL